LWIGGPSVTAQSTLAAGTLVLTTAGRLVEAAVFAGCVRLLSGINAVNAVVAMSLYPRLARDAASAEDEGDGRMVAIALRMIAVLVCGFTAVCSLAATPIAVALLKTSTHAAKATLVLVVATALPLGNIVMFNYQMLARGRERATLVPFAVGGGLTVIAAILSVAAGARADVVAAALLTGQLATMALLGARVRAVSPVVSRETRDAMAIAMLVALLACATVFPYGTFPAGLVLLVLTGLLSRGLWPVVRTLLDHMPRRWRRASP
jgi:O-antigen/teichoic acid export membrane protein